MTTAQIYRRWGILVDEAHNEYLYDYQKDEFLNAALTDWFDGTAPLFETSNGVDENLALLVRRFDKPGDREVIVSETNYKRIVCIWARFATPKLRKVEKSQRNQSDSDYNSFKRASDLFPAYTMRGSGEGTKIIEIESTTVPTAVRYDLLMKPPKFDSSKAEFEWDGYLPDAVQNLIIRKAIGLAGLTENNQLAAQAGAQAQVSTS